MAKQIDLILINPASRPAVYQSLGQELAAVEPPVWARLMASFCIQSGLTVLIIDAEAEELGPRQVARSSGWCGPCWPRSLCMAISLRPPPRT